MENHLDPFFKGKLADHETPFAEAHWMQMQFLLKEQKRKKKRFFFWLLFSVLLLAGIGSWLVWTNGDQKVPNQKQLPVKSMDGKQGRSDVATSSVSKNNQPSIDQAVANNSDTKAVENAKIQTESGGSNVSIIATSRPKNNQRKSANKESNASILPDEKSVALLETQTGNKELIHSASEVAHSNSVEPTALPGTHMRISETLIPAVSSKAIEALAPSFRPLVFQKPGLRSILANSPWEFYLGAGVVVTAKEISKPGMRLEIGTQKEFHRLGIWSVGAGMEWWNNSPAVAVSAVNEVQYGFGRTEYSYELKPADLRVLYAQLLWQMRIANWHLHAGPQVRYLPLQKSNLYTYSSSSLLPDKSLLRSEQGYQNSRELQLRNWLPGLQAGIQYRWKRWEIIGSAQWMKGTWLTPTDGAPTAKHTFTLQSQIRYYIKWN